MLLKTRKDVVDWRDLKASELAVIRRKLRDEIPEVRVPSVVGLWFTMRYPFACAYTRLYVQRICREWLCSCLEPLEMGRGVVIRMVEWRSIPHSSFRLRQAGGRAGIGIHHIWLTCCRDSTLLNLRLNTVPPR